MIDLARAAARDFMRAAVLLQTQNSEYMPSVRKIKIHELELDIPALPNKGDAGQVLAKRSGADGDASWVDLDESLAVSSEDVSTQELALPTPGKRSYKTAVVTSTSTLALTGGTENPGYEHYLLIINAGASDLAVSMPTGSLCGEGQITIPSNRAVEISYIYTGDRLVVTTSSELSTNL